MRKLGILGGTFDPIHRGHLAMAAAAQRACRLDQVLFVPAERPWHRAAPRASFPDRYAMVALALTGRAAWLPLAVPALAQRPTYALDQVAWIAARHPRARLHFILGADAFAALPTWWQYRRLLASCDFIVLARHGVGIADVLAAVPPRLLRAPDRRGADLAGGRRLHWIEAFSSPQSATGARAALAQRSPKGAEALPAAVRAFARRAGLYGKTSGQVSA
ncbi:MAG: nicotinate-nicotinamide nucleotide adenylyltransferase [Terriglobales bacterium]